MSFSNFYDYLDRRHSKLEKMKMGRRLKILDPYVELCGLIEKWVINQNARASAGLGYPSKAAGFGDAIQVQSQYVDPTGFSAWDHDSISVAIDKLAQADRELFAAFKMYYMPWTIHALTADGFPAAPNQTFYNRLLRVHQWLDSEWRAQLSLVQNQRREARSVA